MLSGTEHKLTPGEHRTWPGHWHWTPEESYFEPYPTYHLSALLGLGAGMRGEVDGAALAQLPDVVR